MAKIDHIDDNAQCPHCWRWFSENYLGWHIKTVHGPNAAEYHKTFVENAKRTHEKKKQPPGTRNRG